MKKALSLILVAIMGMGMLVGCSNARQIEENKRIIEQSKKNIDIINKYQAQSDKVKDAIDAYKNN